jgi:hypothetical protein
VNQCSSARGCKVTHSHPARWSRAEPAPSGMRHDLADASIRV